MLFVVHVHGRVHTRHPGQHALRRVPKAGCRELRQRGEALGGEATRRVGSVAPWGNLGAGRIERGVEAGGLCGHRVGFGDRLANGPLLP